MAFIRTTMNGLDTDSPPIALGDKALFTQNMMPASATSVRPRYGSTSLQTFEQGTVSARIVFAYAEAADPSMTVFIVCTSQLVTGSGPSRVTETNIEAVFEFYPGETVYNYTVAQTGRKYSIFALDRFDDFETNLPTAVQFGQRLYLYYPDQRPILLMEGPGTTRPGILIKIDCGIQAPVSQPYLTTSTTNANNLVYDANTASLNNLQIGYSYFSSARNSFSQPSPLAQYSIPNSSPVKKILINGFWPSRDDAELNLIDYIVVGVQSGINTGMMALFPDTYISITPVALTGIVTTTLGSFALTGTSTLFLTELGVGDIVIILGASSNSYTISAIADNTHATMFQAGLETFSTLPGEGERAPRTLFDLSPGQLALGFDLNALASALYIPPSVASCERFGEGIWMGRQRKEITATSVTVSVDPPSLGLVGVTNGTVNITGTNFDTLLMPFDTVSINTGAVTTTVTIATITSATTATLLYNWADTTATNAQATRLYRNLPLTRITTATPGVFSTAHLHMRFFYKGAFLGTVFDVDVFGQTIWIIGENLGTFADTTLWSLRGLNDRIWRTGYTNAAPGNTPTTFPETVQLQDFVLFSQAIDQGQQFNGLLSTLDELRVAFDSCFVRVVGGNEIGVPLPDLRTYYGLAGCIAPRSLCRAPTGEMAWISIEGIMIDTASGPRNVAAELGCQALFRGGQWIAREDLPNIVMCYSRELNGFIFANFTINGEAGWWGIVTLSPQYGIFLCNNQLFTSNILEFSNQAGRAKLLGGDNRGRLKWFADDLTLLDVSMTDDVSRSYTCIWQEGYNAKEDDESWSVGRVKFPGIIIPFLENPAEGGAGFLLRLIRTNFAERELGYLGSDDLYTTPVSIDYLQPNAAMGIPPNMAKYQSVGVAFDSTFGSVTNNGRVSRPMEIPKWIAMEGEDG